MMRPAANTPTIRGTRTSPVSVLTRTSTNCAPKACRERFRSRATSSVVLPFADSPPSGTPRFSIFARSFRQAFATAQPQDAVPIEPPATVAIGSRVSPIITMTRSAGTSSSSAAMVRSAVRAPVPMSVALIASTYWPCESTITVATDGTVRTG